jgi:hypothetical protein
MLGKLGLREGLLFLGLRFGFFPAPSSASFASSRLLSMLE